MIQGAGSAPFAVVVIGASQAGLAASCYLSKLGVRFVILDAGSEIGEVWGSRWDSLTLFTPAQYSGLPGLAFPAPKDTYPSKDDVASYLRSYVSELDLPVRLDAKVMSLSPHDGEYRIATASEELRARHVVVATGPFQVPFLPPVARDLDETVFQIHSADYRNPEQLPDGEVLVVGGGNSGFQIAGELAPRRKVDLAVGQRMPSLPQRVLGRDLFWWLSGVGFMKVTTDSRLGRKLAKRDVLIGSSPRAIRRAGVTLRGGLTGASGRRVRFENGSQHDVDSIVWATGYRPDYSWIDVPSIKGRDGSIVHRRGVTDVPGLWFVGLPWQHTRGSALIGFVHDDASFIVDRIASQLEGPAGLVATDARRT